MVREQLIPRGIRDERVLDAMRKVPRHLFVPEEMAGSAYDDCALSIGQGQTISQPYMVAVMTQLLELQGGEKVLEIGTGSGYQSAVISLLATEVYTVERISSLSESASVRLQSLGFGNVHAVVADGSLGLAEESPFDGIIVTAAAPDIPNEYLDQLAEGGRLVIPVGSRYSQVLYQMIRTPDGIRKQSHTPCAFVPLVGAHGWDEGRAD